MEEKKVSAFDLLEEILERLDTIEKKIDSMGQNANNHPKTAKISLPPAGKLPQKTTTPEATSQPPSTNQGFKNFAFQPTDAAKMEQNAPLAVKNRLPANSIAVTGKMVANMSNKVVPLSGVSVKIFNDKDALVKETKTNKAGHWTSFLPPGRYVALFEGQFNGKNLIPQNRNFTVPDKLPDGQIEFVVV